MARWRSRIKVLFTGKGGAGSWLIRGEQLGYALSNLHDVTICPNATDKQIQKADVCILVKKGSADLIDRLQKAKRLVWDTVDCWPQPTGNAWSREVAINEMSKIRSRISPCLTICATKAMAEDVGGEYLYHHHRPSIKRATVHTDIKRVGYDGDKRYLAEWSDILERQCRLRGWEFVYTDDLSTVDVAVAFRGGIYDGYAPRVWKSNVKLANAQGSGVPFICSPEMGYIETDKGGVWFANSEQALSEHLDCLTYEMRLKMAEALLASAYTVDDAAKDLSRLLSGL